MSSPAPPDACLVLVTCPNLDVARGLARQLVLEELLACANLIPGITSVYRWEGEVQEDGEVLLLGKTRRARLGTLERRVLELHPYDTPEFVVVAAEHVEARYAAWLQGATGGD